MPDSDKGVLLECDSLATKAFVQYLSARPHGGGFIIDALDEDAPFLFIDPNNGFVIKDIQSKLEELNEKNAGASIRLS